MNVDNIEFYVGNGVNYSASQMNILACEGEIVEVVGGASSAGRPAALFLSEYAEEVHFILRGGDLATKMSDDFNTAHSDCREY